MPDYTINHEMIPFEIRAFIEIAVSKNPELRFENACIMLQHWLALDAISEKDSIGTALAPGQYVH